MPKPSDEEPKMSKAQRKAIEAERLAAEAEEKRRKRYTSKNDRTLKRAIKEPRPIIATNTEFKGAYAAATQLAIEMEIGRRK